MKVVVCGGGAVGAACAYYLSRRGAEVVVERAGIACAASGKSGGFLARDWCDGSPLEPLARRNFDLHAALHRELAGDWDHRPMTAYAGILGARGRVSVPLSWLSDRVDPQSRIGSPAPTAQVHPGRFTNGLMRAAEAQGARLVIGKATGLARVETRAVTGVIVNGERIAANRVVVAMGPWSIRAADWADLPAIHAVKGHSLVFDAPDIPADALFLEHRDDEGRAASAFLFWHGVKSLLSALRSSEALVADASLPVTNLFRTLVACLALTWLNPHVYLDTAVLLGTISTQLTSSQGSFAVGAILGSFVFFFALGYGAIRLRPVFERPAAWRIFETLIALVMWIIAYKLLAGT
jgi:hypothetical protein